MRKENGSQVYNSLRKATAILSVVVGMLQWDGWTRMTFVPWPGVKHDPPLVSDLIRARLAMDAAIADVRGDCVNVARDLAMKEVGG